MSSSMLQWMNTKLASKGPSRRFYLHSSNYIKCSFSSAFSALLEWGIGDFFDGTRHTWIDLCSNWGKGDGMGKLVLSTYNVLSFSKETEIVIQTLR